ILWRYRLREAQGGVGPRILRSAPGGHLAALVGTGAFKVALNTRDVPIREMLSEAGRVFLPERVTDGLRLPQAVEVGLGTWGVGLPFSATQLLKRGGDSEAIVAALVAGALVFWILGRLGRDAPARSEASRLIGNGIGVFCLGWALFLITGSVQLTA